MESPVYRAFTEEQESLVNLVDPVEMVHLDTLEPLGRLVRMEIKEKLVNSEKTVKTVKMVRMGSTENTVKTVKMVGMVKVELTGIMEGQGRKVSKVSLVCKEWLDFRVFRVWMEILESAVRKVTWDRTDRWARKDQWDREEFPVIIRRDSKVIPAVKEAQGTEVWMVKWAYLVHKARKVSEAPSGFLVFEETKESKEKQDQKVKLGQTVREDLVVLKVKSEIPDQKVNKVFKGHLAEMDCQVNQETKVKLGNLVKLGALVDQANVELLDRWVCRR